MSNENPMVEARELMKLVRLIGEVEVLQEDLGLAGAKFERLPDLKAAAFERLGKALVASREAKWAA